jgi:hypothetical protein
VLKATGGAWIDLGRVASNTSFNRLGSTLVVDALDRPVIAHVEWGFGAGDQLLVARLEGGSWTQLGGVVNATRGGGPRSPRLWLGEDGEPVVAWLGDSGAVRRVFCARWDGAAWQELGGEVPWSGSGGDVTAVAVASGPGGSRSMAYVMGGTTLLLARLDPASGAWISRAAMNTVQAEEIALAVDEEGVEVVTYVESGGPWGSSPVRVLRWASDFSGFHELPSPSAAGDRASVRSRAHAAPGEGLVVSFLESGPRVAGWSGTSWRSISEEIGVPSNSLYHLVLDTLSTNDAGVLAYGWAVLEGPYLPRLQVARYNR